MNPQDVIEAYYAKKKSPKAGRTRPVLGWDVTPTFEPIGLGDTVMLTDILDASDGKIQPHSWSHHFHSVFSRTMHQLGKRNPMMVDLCQAYHEWDLGGGHLTQRFRRLFGIPVQHVPSGSLRSISRRRKGRVILHIEAGKHVEWQRVNIHPRAREFYPEHLESLQAFARERKDLEFVTVGGRGLYWCSHQETRDAAELIDFMATGEWFVGIVSGPMHVAAALGLKSVVALNFPDPRKIMLPTVCALGTVEEEWLYPQNVHLHEDASGPLVPKFSKRNLHRAFDGEVYPFWKTDLLGLVE
jgi:hypothetical protein